jgi:hypothetical protein
MLNERLRVHSTLNIQHLTFNIRLGPLTSRQRLLIAILCVFVAATRFLAVSHSMWDWDEVLFAAALHHYDVAQHHPHPPGFPLFFALAKIARTFIHDDFHSLRAISVLASLFVFPAMFALARSLRFRFRTCVVAALLFSFLPNVWYWGGTGFTDELALVTALAGAAFLLRDDRRSTYILGCIFFAATMLVRAQNVLLAWPWIVASWRRWRGSRRTNVIIGTSLILALVTIGYGIAAKLSGIDDYLFALKSHQQYIVNVDGLLNPIRLPMREIFFRFLFNPFQSGAASMVMFVFTLIAFARPRRAHLDAVLTFIPNFFLTWFFLNPTGVSRLSLAYIAMNALLAADGMDVAATFIASRLRALPRERIAAALQAVFAAVLIGRYIVWVWPGLQEIRRHDSPPVLAMRWVRTNVPRGAKIYLAEVLEPFPAYFLAPDYTIVTAPDRFDPSTVPAERNAYFVTDVLSPSTQAVNFRRTHKRLWSLFNERYFEASVQPISGWIRFGQGWYVPEQGAEGERWRWMGKESHTTFEALAAPAVVGFTATFPLDGEPPPYVTVIFDGNMIDRFVPQKKDVERTYAVQSRSVAPDELVISVDQAINPARTHPGGDSRDLGMQLHNLTWKRR